MNVLRFFKRRSAAPDPSVVRGKNNILWYCALIITVLHSSPGLYAQTISAREWYGDA